MASLGRTFPNRRCASCGGEPESEAEGVTGSAPRAAVGGTPSQPSSSPAAALRTGDEIGAVRVDRVLLSDPVVSSAQTTEPSRCNASVRRGSDVDQQEANTSSSS
eukprot:scaffold7378_cov410-Prasinococcus_capsulatus_cf.AAC.11